MKCARCFDQARPDYTTCADCGARQAEHLRRARAAWKARGWCSQGCRTPAAPGRGGLCDPHANRAAALNRAARQRR